MWQVKLVFLESGLQDSEYSTQMENIATAHNTWKTVSPSTTHIWKQDGRAGKTKLQKTESQFEVNSSFLVQWYRSFHQTN